MSLTVATGDHDALSVPLSDLGSGLQSLLDLAFQESVSPSGRQVVIAIEEPEAFLHPAAQRTVAWRLLFYSGEERQVIVTTHSPTVVEEAQFGDIFICRNQKFYEPNKVSDEKREEINTALLSGFGAEMIFASAVLFVEGDGDRQFFEQLRRRIAKHDPKGRLNTCFVVPVGGKSRYSPWIRLVDSYGTADDRPIRWLAVCDADASKEIRDGLHAAGITLKQEMLKAFDDVTKAKNSEDLGKWRLTSQAANATAKKTATSIHFMVLDLEEDALQNAGDDFLKYVSNQAGWEPELSKAELLKRLGAKGFGGGNGAKNPWLRGLIGNHIQPNNISEGVRSCLHRWFSLVLEERETEQILKDWMA